MSGRVRPSSRANVKRNARSERQKAALLYERFTGHEAEPLFTVDIPPPPSHVAIIGSLTAVCYSTVRDGRAEDYIHEFAEKDQPLLAVSPNGRQLFIVEGRYRFTSLGIVDASDKAHRNAR